MKTNSIGNLPRTRALRLLGFGLLAGILATCVVGLAPRRGASLRPWVFPRQASGPRIVYAHYMHAFVPGYVLQPPRPEVKDMPNWPAKEFDVRSWWTSRMEALMRQSGDEALKEDFKLLNDAGLDAIALLVTEKALLRPTDAPTGLSLGLLAVAAIAQHDKVKIILDLWPQYPLTPEKWLQYGQMLKAFIDAHPGAFLLREGKPVVSIYAPGVRDLEWSTWEPLFQGLGGRGNYYVIVDSQDPMAGFYDRFGENTDAFTAWTAGVSWGNKDWQTFAPEARKFGKDIVWPVHTNEFSVHGGGSKDILVSEGLGISTFMDQYRDAILGHAAMVEVISWNDMSEDHAITETNYRGRSLIDLNAYMAEWYRSGEMPAITKDRLFLFHHRQKVDARLTDGTVATADPDKWVTPPVDYVNVLSMLTAPGRLTLKLGGGASYDIDAPAGLHEWLLYAPNPRSAPDASKQAYSRPDSYPTPTNGRSVTVVSDVQAGTPEVVLSRGGAEVLHLVSKLPISDTGKYADLSMVGDVSP